MWTKKEMSHLDATLTRVPLTLTFDLEFSRSICILGIGRPNVMKRKRRDSIGCPDLKHNHYVNSRQRILLATRMIKDVGVSVDSSSGYTRLNISIRLTLMLECWSLSSSQSSADSSPWPVGTRRSLLFYECHSVDLHKYTGILGSEWQMDGQN